MQDIFIGRQPIFDRDLNVIAYELLYRAGMENRAGTLDGDLATTQVLLNAFMEIGLQSLVGKHLAFINLTRGFLTGDIPLPPSSDGVVLEVLEDIEVDTALINAVRDLSERGYSIALDDFIYHERLRPLVDIADYVKIDVRALDRVTVAEHVRELKKYRSKLLAEKVETAEEFEYYKTLGFDCFQGYFLSRPNVIKAQRLSTNRLAVLNLVAQLQSPDTGFAELERIIGRDVGLSFKLLRYLNSAFFAMPRKIESIHQAIVYLGIQPIRNWATLLALSNIGDKPYELMTEALVRARMCELLAISSKQPEPERYFTVGLFSMLDALLDTPLEEILDGLPLTDEMKAALLREEGPPGAALHCARAYERGDWDDVHCHLEQPNRIIDAYLEAVRWADRAMQQIGA